MKQRQKWMNEHHLKGIISEKKRNNDEEKLETNENIEDFNAQILNEMTHKISVRLQNKISSLDLNESSNVSYQVLNNENSSKLNDLIENELNFNCSICMEMMISPYKEPLLLIPCSHSFCKQCIFHIIYKNQKNIKQLSERMINNQNIKLPINSHKKCPFCREKIKSFVGNIQLRQLIEKMVELKDEETKKLEKNINDQKLSLTNKQLLKFRKQIIYKELKKVKKEKYKIDEKMNSYQLIIDHLRNEEIQTKKRLNLIKRELELIENELNIKLDDMIKLKIDRNKANGKYNLLQSCLDKLESELDKSDILCFES